MFTTDKQLWLHAVQMGTTPRPMLVYDVEISGGSVAFELPGNSKSECLSAIPHLSGCKLSRGCEFCFHIVSMANEQPSARRTAICLCIELQFNEIFEDKFTSQFQQHCRWQHGKGCWCHGPCCGLARSLSGAKHCIIVAYNVLSLFMKTTKDMFGLLMCGVVSMPI